MVRFSHLEQQISDYLLKVYNFSILVSPLNNSVSDIFSTDF